MKNPITIFIVGTTAVGKTKLSIQLCKAIGGQVINCDSKQLYKNANIMTAKATTQQIQGITHHMLDILELNQNCYNRNKYYFEAAKCLEDIKSRGKIPVVVGGTNYYLETLLYDIGIGENYDNQLNIYQKQKQIQQDIHSNQKNQQKVQQEQQHQQETGKRITKQQIEQMTREQKYIYLKQVDKIMAQKVHQNDQTRIRNFLIRYSQTGVPPSANYKPYVHKLRQKNSVLFWVRNSEKTELHELMKNRIKKMIQEGGLVQILAVFRYVELYGFVDNGGIDGIKMGVLQSIGYKQFQQVYHNIRDLLVNKDDSQKYSFNQIHAQIEQRIKQIRQKLSKIESKSIATNKNIPILQKCTQVLIKNTIQYSKKQLTWIRNRLFACQENRDNFFVLELQDKNKNRNFKTQLLQRFQKQVKIKALQIIEKISKQGIGCLKQSPSQFQINKHQSITQWKKYYCQKCNVEKNGSYQWKQHLNTRKHREGMTKKQRMREIRQEKKILTNQKYSHLRTGNDKNQCQQNGSQQDQDNNGRQKIQQNEEIQDNQHSDNQIIKTGNKISNNKQQLNKQKQDKNQ